MGDRAPVAILRARADDRATWPAARDLVFAYRAGERAPRDWEAALPEVALLPLAHAMFAALAPGRPLGAPTPIEGHQYNWGTDLAAVTADGDGILVADRTYREERYDVVPLATVFHVVVRDEICAVVETGSSAQRSAEPRVTIQLSASAAAIDPATDAILECATAAGLALVERVDAPVRVPRPCRTSGAVRAFAQVDALAASDTAKQFAWIWIGMVPAWFGFAPDEFAVELGSHSDCTLAWKSPRHPGRRASVRLSSSRVMHLAAHDGDTEVDRGEANMHYQPSDEAHERAQLHLLCALRWLHPDRADAALPAELVERIAPGRVFVLGP